MSNTRREFLQSGAALAAGLMGGAATKLAAEEVKAALPPGRDTQLPAATVQVPKMKFGNVEISRMVMGVNTLYGFAHFNNNYSGAMRDWYTPEKVCEVLHRANSFGITAFNFVDVPRSGEDLARFQGEGGKMHLIMQVTANNDSADLVRKYKPLALQRRGEETDVAFRNGTMAAERDWCKKARDLGVMVGVGAHNPDVISMVEDQGWDVDFFSGCIYRRSRTPEEWKQVLHGEMMELPNEIYLQSDPARMYKVLRQTAKPCFAFKILAAGRIEDEAGVKQAFRTAFESIKPIDGIYVGMFPRGKDEIKENSEIVHSLLTNA